MFSARPPLRRQRTTKVSASVAHPAPSDGKQERLEPAAELPVIAGYHIDRIIGEGGFGQVWHAHRESGERVAIKVLHLELVRSIDALTRFQRELDAIQRLRHDNVVRALDHGTLSDGRPYLILEYIEGPSLREVIAERGAIPPHDVLAILEPLCDALALAHEAGLVHRDVKASNVILATHADGKLRPVLLDFGLVKLLDQQGPGLTSSRSMLGTPAAMAPEQMRGQSVDARTDIYAVGLLAFHMLTGQPAFGGAPGVVQSYLQVHGPRPRPSAKVDIDPAIDEPIARALAPNPDDRYGSIRDLIGSLRAVIAPTAGAEDEVVAVYGEGKGGAIARALGILRDQDFIIAMTAPDSVLAVMPRSRANLTQLRHSLEPLAAELRIAVGCSRASICGLVVDGPALDVEGWAPYPLPMGLWISADL